MCPRGGHRGPGMLQQSATISRPHVCPCRDIMGQSGFSGVPPDSARPSKRPFAAPLAKSYHLHGTGVQVDSQMPAMRKSRGWGTRPRYTLVNTSARILGTGAGEVKD